MATNPEPDYYEILGVEDTATPEEIDKAFRKARRDNHPDKSSTGAWAFRLVEAAYETLKDPDRRADYDRIQRNGGSSVTAGGGGATSSSTPPPPSSPTTNTSSTPSNVGTSNVNTGHVASTATSAPVTSNATAQPMGARVDVVRQSEYENNQTDLEKFNFSPPENQYLMQIFGGLGVSLVGTLLMFFSGFHPLFPPVVVFGGLFFTLLAVFLVTKKQEIETSGKVAAALLIIGWIITGASLVKAVGGPMSQPVYLLGDVMFMLGGIVALLFMPKYMKIRELNKRIPTKLLKEYRIFGSAASLNPLTAATLRNVSTTIAPITAIKDGSFLMHVDGLKLGDKKYPANMIVVRGNKVAVVTYMITPPGKYGVSTDGNILQIIGDGITHVENYNPEVLQGCQAIKKAKGVETRSFVVLVPNMAGPIEPYFAETTVVVGREEALKALVDWFEDPVDTVRRDVLDTFVPSLSN